MIIFSFLQAFNKRTIANWELIVRIIKEIIEQINDEYKFQVFNIKIDFIWVNE